MAGEEILGVFLAALGAAALALAMSVQRYALTTPPPVPCICGLKLSQFSVWFTGLVIYWIANGLFAVALIFAPLALLGAIFTTLLIWNLVFGRLLLGEKLTLMKMLGAGIIMVGVSLIGIATPTDIKTEYTADEAEAYLTETSGYLYLLILGLIVVVSIVVIVLFEYKYPLEDPEEQEKVTELDPSAGLIRRSTINKLPTLTDITSKLLRRQGLHIVKDGEMPSIMGMSKEVEQEGLTAVSKQIHIMKVLEKNWETPKWMDMVMGIVYPGSLGIDEGIGHLAMKSFMAVLASCGDNDDCTSGIFWGMVVLWLGTSLATLWWLRTVFRRYDVTQALPIEYGGVMICDALSALIYYKEDSYMEEWQLLMVIGGVCVIVLGIMIGRIQSGSSPGSKPI
jgi:hypothetical protein